MDPEDIADSYVRKADSLASGKRYEEAIALYDRAIGAYPDCSEAWTNKASALRLLGKLQEALECAEKALEIGPSPIAEVLSDNLIDELRRKGIIR
jgi:tetratricopeptide (TPR) repeat protein